MPLPGFAAGTTAKGKALAAVGGSCVVALIYYLAARLGLNLLTEVGDVAVFWPAAGVAAGILLAFGQTAQLPIMAGIVAATVAANVAADRTVITAVGKGLCNAGEAALFVRLLRSQLDCDLRLDGVRCIAAFAGAAMVAAAVAAVPGAAIMLAFHVSAPYFELWRAWFLSDYVGIISVTPFVLGVVAIVRNWPPWHEVMEAVVLLALLWAVTNYVYWMPGDTWIALIPGAIPFPIVLLLAARCSPTFTPIGAFMIAFTIICAMTFGVGRFGDTAVPVAERAFAAQAGAVLVTLSMLILAALFEQRRTSEIVLRHSNDRLQDSNEHLQLALQGADLGTFSLELPSRRFRCDERAAHLHGFNGCSAPTIGEFCRFIDPLDQPMMDAAIEQAAASGNTWRSRYKVTSPDRGRCANQATWVALDGSAIRDAEGRPVRVIGVVRDITEEKVAEEKLRDQIEAERQVLAKLSASVPLSSVLEELVCAVEAVSDAGMIASILFLDKEGKRLVNGAAPHLPASYSQAINGIEIGPNVGSCGRAAFLGEPVLVADISTNPYWANYRQVALGHGLKACSSMPIKAADGRVLGTFAIYYRDARLPTERDLEALARFAHVTALAIERHASDQVMRDTRERLQLALDSAQLGVWSVNLRTGTFENDERDRRHHGHNAAFPPRTLAEARRYVEPADLAGVEAAFATAGSGGLHTSAEYRVRNGAADPVWLAVEGTVLLDATGAPAQLLGITRDVTKQKQLEQNLRNQQQALERLLGALPVAIYTTDMLGRITYCNQCAIDLWRRCPRLGTDIWFTMAKFYRPDGVPMRREECPLGSALDTGKAVSGREAVIERLDGSRVPIMACPAPLRDDEGKTVGFVSMMLNLVEQKRAEAALSERSAQLRVAERAALVGSFSHETGSSSLQLSPGMAAILGLPDETTDAPISSWRSRVEPRDLANLDAGREKAFAGHRLEHCAEYRIVTGGDTRWIESRDAITYDGTGRPLRIAGVNIDVTERKVAERHKSMLIAELDHRVKNALACVVAIAHHTRDCISSMDEFLEVFDGRINSMANTQTLLSRNRWEGVNLSELLQSELAPCAANGNTAVVGPEVLLATEAVQPLAMVIHELVTNSAKYGALSIQEGRVSVSWLWHGGIGEPRDLVMRWQESGGPPVASLARSSYGTAVIRDLIPYELGGKVEHTLRRAGLQCKIQIPGKWASMR